jgi:hypothetical protein
LEGRRSHTLVGRYKLEPIAAGIRTTEFFMIQFARDGEFNVEVTVVNRNRAYTATVQVTASAL